ALHRSALRRVPPPAPSRGVRGQRHRAGQRAPHRRAPRRPGRGRGPGRRGRHVLVHAAEAEAVMKLAPILLVEDSPEDVELTLNALATYNVSNQITVARDGEEALDFIFRRGPFAGRSAENPLVVLLDIKLPKVDGLEVLRQIRAVPAYKS